MWDHHDQLSRFYADSILKCEDGLQDGLRFDDPEHFVMMIMKTDLSYQIVVVFAITSSTHC